MGVKLRWKFPIFRLIFNIVERNNRFYVLDLNLGQSKCPVRQKAEILIRSRHNQSGKCGAALLLMHV